MTKFASFDKATCRTLRNELQAVLEKYAGSTGMTISVGNMRFTAGSVTIKVEATIQGAKSTKQALQEESLKFHAGLDKLSLDVVNGKQLVGYNSRSYKYPYIYIEVATGKRYKTGRSSARVYFATPRSLAA